MIHWRRHRTNGLARYWDKDFNLIGTQASIQRVEPWWRWMRRLAAEIAATLRRHEHRPVHITVDETADPRRAYVRG